MTRKEIIDGLKFTVEMFLFNSSIGEKITEPRNDMDKTTIDACRGAIELLEQEPSEDAISRQVVLSKIKEVCFSEEWTQFRVDNGSNGQRDFIINFIENSPSVQPKTGWNNHQIACMLADLFGDACACNYNGIDEWLSELCDFKDTCCPNPVGVACWEQFLKYSQSRYTECGYEVRDKNALQEPKTGHWILTDDDFVYCSECEDSYYPRPIDASWYYCPHCGAKMVQESEG